MSLRVYSRIFIARLDDTDKNNWIYQTGYLELSNSQLYVTSIYFTITTLVTVGYGDITAYSMIERVMCSILMVLGVLSFSFASGALASIITSYDVSEAQLKEKIATLNEISNGY
jgi:Ion channel